MFCVKCGNEIEDGAAFCPQCGQPVGESPSPNAAPPTGATPSTGMPRAQKGSVTDTVGKAIGTAADKLYEVTGGSGHAQLKFKDFFTDVFKHHERGESEEIFICGTKTTTPDISDVSAEWPRPWVWSRVLVVLLATLAILYLLALGIGNRNGLPGLIFIGAAAVPFSVLIFFFETNIPRNISLVRVVTIFFVGGAASLIVIYLLPPWLSNASGAGPFWPSMITGLIEEFAKAAIVVAIFNIIKKQNDRLGVHKPIYILNGLLIGAAVGAGFAVFETAGYIFNSLLNFLMDYNGNLYFNYGSMNGTLFIRALLAIGGHVAWAAAEGAALALAERESGYDNSQIADPRFLIVFVLCVVLHGLWDTTVPVLDTTYLAVFEIKYIVLIVAIWVIIAVMMNRGLDQINELANAASSNAAGITASDVQTKAEGEFVTASQAAGAESGRTGFSEDGATARHAYHTDDANNRG